MTRHRLPALAFALLVTVGGASSVAAQIAISGNDNKVLLVNGVVTVVQNPPADTVSVIDLKASPPRVIGEVRSEEHTSELQSVESSYAVFCLKKKKKAPHAGARQDN